jgi:hypothetical protein
MDDRLVPQKPYTVAAEPVAEVAELLADLAARALAGEIVSVAFVVGLREEGTEEGWEFGGGRFQELHSGVYLLARQMETAILDAGEGDEPEPIPGVDFDDEDGAPEAR